MDRAEPERDLELAVSEGASRLPDRTTFDELARRDDVPGALGAREVKFLMVGVDGPNPRLYFINTTNTPFHYDFATKVLGMACRSRSSTAGPISATTGRIWRARSSPTITSKAGIRGYIRA